jgi:hypothetical protein
MKRVRLTVVVLLGLGGARALPAQTTLGYDARLYGGYYRQNTLAGERGPTATTWLMAHAQAGRFAADVMLSADPLLNGECGQPRLLPDSFHCGDAESLSHPLVMNLGLSARVGAFVLTASAVGEPAYGPHPHFMRASAQHDPGEPLTHHFFNPAHSAHGVVTLGATRGAFTIEGSAFNGRHQTDRYEIDVAPLDPSTGPARCCSWASRRSTPPWPPTRPTSCSSTRATSSRRPRSSTRTPRWAARPRRPASPGRRMPDASHRGNGSAEGSGAAGATGAATATVDKGAQAALGTGIALTELLSGFISELRTAGLPVSLTENLDAMQAVQHIPVDDREAFKYALGATLVKNAAHWRVFETVFEVYFSLRGRDYALTDEQADMLPDLEDLLGELAQQQEGEMRAGGAGGETMTPEQLAEMLYKALQQGNEAMLKALARQAVKRYAGMEPGRPVGGTYYLYRTLRNLDLDGVLDRLMGQAREQSDEPLSPLEERLERDEYESRIDQLRKEIEAEIRRRLVADRGVDAMARTLRKPLPEDVDFMHASREEMAALRKAPVDRRPDRLG